MYTSRIPDDLATKLLESGLRDYLIEDYGSRGLWWIPTTISYATVFDWLSAKGIIIALNPAWDTEGCIKGWVFKVYRVGRPPYPYTGFYEIWEEAANNAIRKALELI